MNFNENCFSSKNSTIADNLFFKLIVYSKKERKKEKRERKRKRKRFQMKNSKKGFLKKNS